MSDKLTEIMAWKRRELAPLLRPVALPELVLLDATLPSPPSFAAALRRSDGQLAIIAEIKRRSPSAGDIKAGANALDQARRYQAAGADALSVLTDEKYFGGSLADLRGVTEHFRKNAPAIPCLRKDFMVHPLQVVQAREAGASAILIIVRALAEEEIRILQGAARSPPPPPRPGWMRSSRFTTRPTSPAPSGTGRKSSASITAISPPSRPTSPSPSGSFRNFRATSSRSARAGFPPAPTPPASAPRAPTPFSWARR